jgi:predicted RNA binding protein YcfA (HicA-like mRNA interferase family)
MPKLYKVLSAKEVVKILENMGFVFKSQTGSHIKMLKIVEGKSYSATVPNHKPIRLGTLSAIYKQILEIPDVDIDKLDKEFKN